MLLAQAGDDASMGRLLRRSIRNWLIDETRKTDWGALRRRLETVLAAEAVFEKVPAGQPGAGRWRLVGQAVPPWSGRTGDLVEAARAVAHVKVPPWSSSGRRSPIPDRASIVAVARVVFEAAAGSVETAELVAVFAARFPVVLDRAIIPLPDDADLAVRDDDPTPEAQAIAAEDELDAGVTAAEIVAMLTPTERQLVPNLDNPQLIQQILGLRRSQANQHVRRLKEKLVQLIGETDDPHGIGVEVIRLCGGVAVSG